jgi:hypothetical protein
MGVAYEEEDFNLRRYVTLKFLPPEMERDPRSESAYSAEPSPHPCSIIRLSDRIYLIHETEKSSASLRKN